MSRKLLCAAIFTIASFLIQGSYFVTGSPTPAPDSESGSDGDEIDGPVVVGIVIGGLFGILLLLFGVWYYTVYRPSLEEFGHSEIEMVEQGKMDPSTTAAATIAADPAPAQTTAPADQPTMTPVSVEQQTIPPTQDSTASATTAAPTEQTPVPVNTVAKVEPAGQAVQPQPAESAAVQPVANPQAEIQSAEPAVVSTDASASPAAAVLEKPQPQVQSEPQQQQQEPPQQPADTKVELLPDWTEHEADDGRKYYWNSKTQESRWSIEGLTRTVPSS